MNPKRLSTEALQTFEAICRDGLTRAAQAMSQVVGDEMQLQASQLQVVKTGSVPALIAQPHWEGVGLSIQMLGDARGSMLLVFDRATAQRLLHRLVPAANQNDPEMGRSMLKEIANILASSFLTTLSHYQGLSLMPSVPQLIESDRALMEQAIREHLDPVGEQALLLEVLFSTAEVTTEAMTGRFLFLPESKTLPLLMTN